MTTGEWVETITSSTDTLALAFFTDAARPRPATAAAGVVAVAVAAELLSVGADADVATLGRMSAPTAGALALATTESSRSSLCLPGPAAGTAPTAARLLVLDVEETGDISARLSTVGVGACGYGLAETWRQA